MKSWNCILFSQLILGHIEFGIIMNIIKIINTAPLPHSCILIYMDLAENLLLLNWTVLFYILIFISLCLLQRHLYYVLDAHKIISHPQQQAQNVVACIQCASICNIIPSYERYGPFPFLHTLCNTCSITGSDDSHILTD